MKRAGRIRLLIFDPQPPPPLPVAPPGLGDHLPTGLFLQQHAGASLRFALLARGDTRQQLSRRGNLIRLAPDSLKADEDGLVGLG